ncbi:MAG: hypothetical protein RI564_02105 [Gracilimonas sp.]|nr:hypothetical protein [Gracilimonas sp.]
MKYLYVTWFLILPMVVLAQQQADTTIGFTIEKPKYNKADSPVLCIDAAHNNYHTAEMRLDLSPL